MKPTTALVLLFSFIVGASANCHGDCKIQCNPYNVPGACSPECVGRCMVARCPEYVTLFYMMNLCKAWYRAVLLTLYAVKPNPRFYVLVLRKVDCGSGLRWRTELWGMRTVCLASLGWLENELKRLAKLQLETSKVLALLKRKIPTVGLSLAWLGSERSFYLSKPRRAKNFKHRICIGLE